METADRIATAKKHHIGTIRRIIQRCASIAGAHAPQAAADIRRTFRVEPDLGPRRIYVAGPYIADTPEEIAANIAAADHIARNVLARGEIPVVPHKLTTGWAGDPRFVGWTNAEWVDRYCLPLLLSCDGIAMVPGWRASKGSVREHDAALRHSIPITYEKL